jgi:hypothetical protein
MSNVNVTVANNPAKPFRMLANLFLAFFIITFVGLLALTGYGFMLMKKREGIAKALHKYFADMGIDVSEDYLYKQLIRMDNRELNITIKFLKALDTKNYPEIIKWSPEMFSILNDKTDMGIISGLLEIKKTGGN